MHVRCPQCHNPIEVVDDTSLAEICCSSCGSSFSLISSDATQTYRTEQRQLAQFELVRELGIGKFGSVWMARDTQLDRTVAIKIPRKGALDAKEAEAFLRDARAAAQLKHPNIVGVHEVGREGDTIYIVSDYVEGANLKEWLSGRRLSFRESAELIVTVAEALDHAHQAGVVHRDLKPGNIMIDRDGQPHVIDFGLAKREAGEVTMTVEGHILGTPAYMSPEQAMGKGHEADRRSDVYSLGVMLFELLTGELPFRGEQQMLLFQIRTDEPPRPRKLNARISRDLETIALKCLEKEPARRYQRAQDLADDLRHYLAGEPIMARPVGRVGRGWRWAKRSPSLAGLAAAVLLLLATVAVGSTIAAVRIAVARNEADARAQEALAEKATATAEREKALASQTRAQEAEAQATEDARRTGIEAEKARQVADFLARMFEESAPFDLAGLRFDTSEKSTAGATLTAREVLDRGAERISNELQGQPLVQAALQETIGNVYIGLGMKEKAEPLLQEALESRQRNLPREHLDIASSLHSIGILRFAQGRYTESAAAGREALAIRRKLLGEDHELVDATRMALATLLGLSQPGGWDHDVPEALKLGRESLAWRRHHFGNAHRQTAFAMLVVAGGCLNGGGQEAEAAKLVLEATPILLKDPTTKSMGVAITQIQQAVIMARLGQRDAVLTATRKGLAAARDVVNSGHPFMAIAEGVAVNSLMYASQYDEAETILQEQIRVNPKSAGPYSDLAWLRSTCPEARFRNGAQAVEYATKACELSEWKNHNYIGTLAAAYAEQGNFEEAIRWQPQAIQQYPSEVHKQRMRERLELYKAGKPYRTKQ